MARLLLLVRHADHTGGPLTYAGKKDCKEVGSALREVLEQLPGAGAIDDVRVLSAGSQEAGESAEAIAARLSPNIKIEKIPELGNPAQGIYSDASLLRRATTAAVARLLVQQSGVTVAVGHQPMLSWIVQTFIGQPVPIGKAELIAMDLSDYRTERHRAVISWTLTPGRRSKELIAELREKIKSKMEAAKFLATFVTAVLGVQAAVLMEPARLTSIETDLGKVGSAVLGGATAMLVLSAGLYFLTVFAYDKLLMPPTLWADEQPTGGERRAWLVRRPPSSAAWILLLNMQRVWKYMFISATGILLGALALQIGVVFYRRMDWFVAAPLIIASAAAVGIIVATIHRAAWPRFGAED